MSRDTAKELGKFQRNDGSLIHIGVYLSILERMGTLFLSHLQLRGLELPRCLTSLSPQTLSPTEDRERKVGMATGKSGPPVGWGLQSRWAFAGSNKEN